MIFFARRAEILMGDGQDICNTNRLLFEAKKTTLKTVEVAALKLPKDDRGKLIAKLLSSLDEEDPAGIDRLWVEEADRRYQAHRSGKTHATPAHEAIARVRKALHR